MSRAKEGDESRTALPNRAAARADVVGFVFGEAGSFTEDGEVAIVSALAKSCRDTSRPSGVVSAVAFDGGSGASWALIMVASLRCCSSSSFKILRACRQRQYM